jgi:hypothetical protein
VFIVTVSNLFDPFFESEGTGEIRPKDRDSEFVAHVGFKLVLEFAINEV